MADNSLFRRINPAAYYECFNGATPVQSVSGTTSVTTNAALIFGFANQRIRLMGWDVHSNTFVANSMFVLKNGSGGSILYRGLTGSNLEIQIDYKELKDSGYCETGTNVGLYMDVVGAQVDFNIFYIVYTPLP